MNHLSFHGGDSVTTVTNSILSEIIQNQFATVVSFTGTGTKAICGIKDTILFDVIIRNNFIHLNK